jgi:hypothetical protein
MILALYRNALETASATDPTCADFARLGLIPNRFFGVHFYPAGWGKGIKNQSEIPN